MSIDQAVKADAKAVPFSLAEGTPVLAKGRYSRPLANSENLHSRVKVYAEGGENAIHTHPKEDHIFFVVGGQATFHLGREGEETVKVNKFEGILVPKRAYYRFESTGDENLVMFRVGQTVQGVNDRDGANNKPLEGKSKENHYERGEPIPGKFFAAN